MLKIAVVGSGKIGTSIIKSMIGKYEVIATARSKETLARIKDLGIETTTDNSYAVKGSDVVILSVKPYHFPSVVSQVKSWEGKTVVSVMAGVKLSTLTRITKTKVFRAMPNINASILESSTAVAGEEDSLVTEILESFGKVYWVQEELIDAWTALVGSGPAFLAEIIDALVMGGVSVGIPRDLAYHAVLDVMKGTANMLKAKAYHPSNLRDEVTTPAGTTIRGLAILEREGVKSALMETIEAAFKRSREIGDEIDKGIREKLNV
ncbi:pyrroline-5-carboxylate reductase [Acidianus sp. RZ1]|uniref:pyrroline-5-carboxylate reductase n=1 Tax=Acidianus sp. RZ1 TaxID=1540082 RepID=UPI001492A931|nr:pyrroline-5-carboxylate reductase [Acidianus sp. RZ1]NON62643.1 pyrroline-5-carboxylate reductase [Acidianus sp. RZ1]